MPSLHNRAMMMAFAAPRRDAPRGRLFSSNGPCVTAVPVRGAKEAHMAAGTIKRIVADRGFGFIAAEDEKEYFFHRGALDSSLEFDRLVGGEKVEFDVEASPKGPRANRVRSA
jgi:CspA family cold shock protein